MDGSTPAPRTLLIACGALAHEIVALQRRHGWPHLALQCLPAELHNRPQAIVPALRETIAAARGRYAQIFVAYADCGTGGALDRLLEAEGIERLPGAHCYAFYAGQDTFARLHDDEPGSFYVTDFLLRHFDRLVIGALGLDRHPELRDRYFGHYRRLVFLAQRAPTAQAIAGARAAAGRLGLVLEVRHTGYGELEGALKTIAVRTPVARPTVTGAGRH